MTYNGEKEAEDYSVWTIDHKTWAVFKCMGESGDCIGEVWDQILSEFLPGSDYQRADSYDFEYYPEKPEAGVFCEIWIPVKRREKS